MLKDNLTELEITKIEQFCSDEAMFDAVKKVLLAAMYYDGALRRGQDFVAKNQAFGLISQAYSQGADVSDATLGASLRGLFEGVNLLEQGYGHLKTIKRKAESVESPYNEAI
jgi:hypothetical protein